MVFIDRMAIQNWANSYSANEIFPHLISKLIHSTVHSSAIIDIALGSAISLGGWDGIVKTEQTYSFVPEGTSLWEFGTNSSVKAKADEDYEKRVQNPLGYEPSECIFIFVTPRLWNNKDKWVTDRKAENVWKDVIVYDSTNISQWLENSAAVAAWFAVKVGILPANGVFDADVFWEEWSQSQDCTLLPEAVTAGREAAMDQLFNFLNGDPGIKAFKAGTKNEAAAFIIAAAKQFAENEKSRFFSKTLLVELEQSYRSISINSQRTPLNLIPKFEEKSILYSAVSRGHHVIVPLGGDDPFAQDVVTLPSISKDGLILALTQMGYSNEDAQRYCKEAANDITILRRLLKFWDNQAGWFKKENLREIVPALFLGRWNTNNEGDREILEKLSGKSYSDYMEIAAKWRDFEDSPLLQIGDTWRLTSPLDLWGNLSPILKDSDFSLLENCFLQIFQESSENNDDYDLTVSFRTSFARASKYSGWAKEGLVQSLILISHYGAGLKISKLNQPAEWVDSLVEKLLSNADGNLWRSLDQKMPLIAEASPKSFLKAVWASLSMPDPPIMEMFKTKAGFLGESSSHTGLLWALEGLAWLPEYLYESTVILLKLSRLDPGGNLVNRPENSLNEIYKPWYFQTLASLEERKEILKNAVFVEKEEGWKLLIRLLPQAHSTASPTHKMRWRLFEKNTNINRTNKDLYETYSFVLDLLLELYDDTDSKLAELIENSAGMVTGEDSEKLLSFIEKNYANIPANSILARNEARKLLAHHRSYNDAEWALPENILDRYQVLYDALEPDDVVLKYQWLFDSLYVQFPDGKYPDDDEDNYRKSHQRLEEKRIDALQNIIGEIGLCKTIKLGTTIESAQAVGETLAKLPLDEEETLEVLQSLKKEKPNLVLGHRYVEVKSNRDGLDWVFKNYAVIQKEDFSPEAAAQLFIPLDHSELLWNFIDTTDTSLQQKYWQNAHPQFLRNTLQEKTRGLNYLLKYKRFISALHSAYMIKKDIPTGLLIEILEKTATEESSEKANLRAYEVSSVFKELGERSDLPEDAIILLEWKYLKILGSQGSAYKPKHLNEELAKSPDFFVEILKWVYMPKDDKRKEEERKGLSNEALKTYAEQGFKLLNDFKTIPGQQPDGKINEEVLNDWVDKVRNLAETEDRIEISDMQIGKVLAQYSEENKDYWPPDEISRIIERINTESLKNNFAVTVTNKRGFTSRGPFDGGDIERANAAHFGKLADLHKFKHPNLSEIFSRIATEYLKDAKIQDDQAQRDRLDF